MTPAEYATQEFGTLAEFVRLQAAAHPDKIAIVDSRHSISYGELNSRIDRIAASLQRDGVQKNGVVAICASSSIEYAAIFVGTIRAGAAISPLAPSSTGEQLVRQVRDSGASHLFVDKSVETSVKGLLEDSGVYVISLSDDTTVTRFDLWLDATGTPPTPVDVGSEDPFNIIYSSGTTGVPKGIVQPHGMRWRHCVLQDPPGFGPDAVTLLSTPLYSNTTLVSFIPTLAGGGMLVLMPKFDAIGYLELAQNYRVTHTMLVPVQYRRLMEQEGFDRYDLSSFKKKFCTSAPFSAELKREVLDRWPGDLIEFFGMTEGGGSCMLEAHLHPDKLHTVGKPMDGHSFLVVGPDGEELPVGQVGEIVSNSPSIMSGYHNRPEETSKTLWQRSDGLIYVRTGDLGQVDEDGFFTVVGRKKDMIVSGGFNIYPSDIEAVINSQPEVAESAVIGVPSERWGETPVAFIVLHPGYTVSAQNLMGRVNVELSKVQRLSELRIVDTLPRSAIGKILKTTLAERYRTEPGEVVETEGRI